MGGVVPLDYRVEDRALRIVEDYAEIMRSLFRRYLEAGSAVRLKQLLDAEDFRLPIRIDGAGKSAGGGLLGRGHIYKILSDPIYVGRIAHKGQVHQGQHAPIVPQDLWDKVQQSLRDHLRAEKMKRTRRSSEALLVGKLFDDRGNRMSPSWPRRGPSAGDTMSRRRLCRARAKRERSFAFRPRMSRRSSPRLLANCP
jgi:site-specific DNA recombinase